MYKKFKTLFLDICDYAEIVMSLALVLVIVIIAVRLVAGAGTLFHEPAMEEFEIYMGNIMILAVGVELVRMLSLHSLSTVIEVLVFALARNLILNHGSSVETLLGVIALAMLFAIKRFLLTPKDHKDKKEANISEALEEHE